MKIVIVGGSGFIGSAISQAFARRGFSVVCVDMVPPKISGVDFVFADTTKNIPQDKKLKNPDGIINLAGVSIVGPWNKTHKDAIYSSRINTTKNLATLCKIQEFRPKFFIQASAVGFYGDCGEETLSEGSPSKQNTYLASVARDWEAEGSRIAKLGVRTVIFRQSNVFGSQGFLSVLRPVYKKRLGGPVGSGDNWLPWIHIDDLVSMYVFAAMEDSVSGIYNCVAPELVRYREFSKMYAKILRKPHFLRIPTWLFRLRYKEFTDEITASQKVVSLRTWEWGKVIRYGKLQDALQAIEKTYE